MKLTLISVMLSLSAFGGDWLVTPPKERTAIKRSADGREVTMANGLIRRVWRLSPDAATVAFDDLMTGASLIRGVKPEAELELDGQHYEVGGLMGQEEWAYLKTKWIDGMKPSPGSFHFVRMESGVTQERFPMEAGRLLRQTALAAARSFTHSAVRKQSGYPVYVCQFTTKCTTGCR